MKLFVCLFLFLFPTLNYGFKKYEMPYSIVIAKADLIVDGTISKVSKNEYEFKISQFVKGKSVSNIKVSIWKEWLCDPRIKELKSGQRLILFLQKTPYGNFAPINESTGEIYVDNGVFINIFLPKEFSSPVVLKKGISMFAETFNSYGNLNDRFLQNVYFVSNKSIFEVYKMKENNQTFKFLVDREVGEYKINSTPICFRLNN
ncbi:hypothetical protein [Flavobacterium johnsoniae]|uniref:Uncharacterized protein n=1 Tax=Flavobacterium johnsoniae (strain ATCC 17061 / DSM 2064 / JCM 8514 / BCRC 14874 / CCUG 350202 / NBRC 14942 / NCIMB 11054 / UW101) TaxID=376686 RepID=A5FFX4_FLAJ1|nr:hypothetical protein [Flavobacterium johnsoniae]ABQ05891.1 hypothetical protein Fjoh_2870 [Flavobacterium johnsoniae UW101]WQG81627.1 hypothetical protein SR927_00715 [Flavobacterium johnsoniae UW101]SHK59249.1 hypothetical protein SAMN05444146_1590 [Flavobacterium johnsoniae]